MFTSIYFRSNEKNIIGSVTNLLSNLLADKDYGEKKNTQVGGGDLKFKSETQVKLQKLL